ncbi:MAG: hypothetical protein ACPGSB_00685 [Opitutales bacterium]
MFTCKQVSNALSKEDYIKMSPLRRTLLKLHIKLCVFCGKFNTQVVESQDMCRGFREHEESLNQYRPKLDEVKKDELKKLLVAQPMDGSRGN